MMPVQLRGHHFLCILTYRGFGYTPGFVDNMSAIVADIAAGRAVRLVAGPDDICAGLSASDGVACDHDCAAHDTRLIDDVAIAEIRKHIGVDFANDITIVPEMVSRLRALFADGTIRGACRDCRWFDFCTAIASEAFSDTHFLPPPEAKGTD